MLACDMEWKQGQQEGFIIPIIHDDKVEGSESFQINVYDLINPFQPMQMVPGRRKRDGLHPLDSSTMFPCATIVIVDDDGESVGQGI